MKVRIWNRISFLQGRNAFIVGLILGIVGGGVQIIADFSRQEERIGANIIQMIVDIIRTPVNASLYI